MPMNSSQQDGQGNGDTPSAGSVGEFHEVRRTFWQHPFVQNVVPVATSVLLHAGVLLVGYATFEVVRTVTTVQREQIIIPDAQIVEGAEVGGVPNPGLGTDPSMAASVKMDLQEQTQKLAEKSASIASRIAADTGGDGVIGVGAGTVALRSGMGGAGDAAGVSPFGVLGGEGGMKPKSPFMGVSGNAKKVIYVCDASGGMVNFQSLLKHSLREAVDVLKPIQFFNILFFTNGGKGYEEFRPRMVPATPANKLAAIGGDDGWVERVYTAEGVTDPRPALRAAMAQEPELVYLMTNGFEKTRDSVAFARSVRDDIRRMNAGRKVLINTILVRTSRTADPEGSAGAKEYLREIEELKVVLKEIADENGGRYRTVDPDQ